MTVRTKNWGIVLENETVFETILLLCIFEEVSKVSSDMDFNQFEQYVKGVLPQLTEGQMEKFRRMESLYKEWNSKINVISRKDIDEGFYEHHVLHSLAIAVYLRSQGRTLGGVVLDLGTGGGFPGIPLAVAFPDAHFILCDSIGKKTIVAKGVAESLGLDNVEVVNARAESLGRRFDFVVSRAVTALVNFYPWVKGTYDGSILYLKGGDVAEETGELMSRFKLPKGSVGVWPIPYEGEWFEQKYVVEIEK